MVRQFFEEQHLMDIVAGEAIRRGHEYAFDGAHSGTIAYGILENLNAWCELPTDG